MASEIRNRFTDTEMQIARETDLPELLSHLGYHEYRFDLDEIKHAFRQWDASILSRRWTVCGSRTGAPDSATLKASAAMRSHSCSSSAIKLFRRQ